MQVGAVLGQNWTASLLARVMEENLPVQDLLRELAEREYLIQEMGGEEPAYSFAHSITQEVAYASLPHTMRERLHERVGCVLEDQFDPIRPNKVTLRHLVHHFMRGSSHDRAAQYLLYAADAGAGIADDTWAMETCRRALEYAHKVRDRTRRRTLVFEVQERMGDALLRQSSLAEAQVAYEAAGDLDEATERGCRLRLKLAHVASRQGNHVRVVGLARAVVDGADLDPLSRAALEARAALSLCSMGQLREADERVTRAMSLVEGVHEGPALDLVLAASAALHRLRGDLAQARELIEDRDPAQVQAIGSEGANDLRVELGQTCFALGDVDAALRIAEEMPQRDTWIYVTSEVLLGRISLERGHIEQARRYLDDALVRAQRIGAREDVLAARMYAAHAALAAARPAEAAEVAHAVAASAEALKLRPMVCEAQAVLSGALVQTHEFARAVEIAREAVVRGRTLRLPIHEAVCRRALGLALVHAGDTAHGRKHLEAAAGVFEQSGARTELTRTLQVISDLSARHRS
jgi:tetratricopeptide (TPR) repeat protein